MNLQTTAKNRRNSKNLFPRVSGENQSARARIWRVLELMMLLCAAFWWLSTVQPLFSDSLTFNEHYQESPYGSLTKSPQSSGLYNPQKEVKEMPPIDPFRAWSNEVTATPQAANQFPNVTNLSFITGDSEVALSWDAVANVDGYEVQRKTGAGAFENIVERVVVTAYVDNDTNTVTIGGPNNGTTYVYRVSAIRFVAP